MCGYVQTGRNFKDKIKKHKDAINRGYMKNEIAAHSWGYQHKGYWSSAKMRSVEQFLWKWKVLEAIHIQEKKRHLNQSMVFSSVQYGHLHVSQTPISMFLYHVLFIHLLFIYLYTHYVHFVIPPLVLNFLSLHHYSNICTIPLLLIFVHTSFPIWVVLPDLLGLVYQLTKIH